MSRKGKIKKCTFLSVGDRATPLRVRCHSGPAGTPLTDKDRNKTLATSLQEKKKTKTSAAAAHPPSALPPPTVAPPPTQASARPEVTEASSVDHRDRDGMDSGSEAHSSGDSEGEGHFGGKVSDDEDLSKNVSGAGAPGTKGPGTTRGRAQFTHGV